MTPPVRRWHALVLIALAAAVAALAVFAVSAHEKAGPHKKLFGKRWHYQVSGNNYDDWMDLTMSRVWLECDTTEQQCGTKWNTPFTTAVADWNSQPTTVRYLTQPDQDIYYDSNVIVFDTIGGSEEILGIDVTYDVNEDVCLHDACSVWYEDVLVADDVHSGPYGTTSERKGTIAHELGHGLSLRHESVNENESVLYPCGQDNHGTIPHSIMSYNCIDPIEVGGLAENYVHEWDVCGVNHAYYDPTIGYADCGAAATATPTRTPTRTPTPSFTQPPTQTPGGATATPTFTPETHIGDVDCNTLINPIDAQLILQLSAGLLAILPCIHNADANASGFVDVVDATLVLQFTAGFLPHLPP